jgi:hypothetical protein
MDDDGRKWTGGKCEARKCTDYAKRRTGHGNLVCKNMIERLQNVAGLGVLDILVTIGVLGMIGAGIWWWRGKQRNAAITPDDPNKNAAITPIQIPPVQAAVRTDTPAPASDPLAKIAQLQQLLNVGAITTVEFEAKKAEQLAKNQPDPMGTSSQAAQTVQPQMIQQQPAPAVVPVQLPTQLPGPVPMQSQPMLVVAQGTYVAQQQPQQQGAKGGSNGTAIAAGVAGGAVYGAAAGAAVGSGALNGVDAEAATSVVGSIGGAISGALFGS